MVFNDPISVKDRLLLKCRLLVFPAPRQPLCGREHSLNPFVVTRFIGSCLHRPHECGHYERSLRAALSGFGEWFRAVPKEFFGCLRRNRVLMCRKKLILIPPTADRRARKPAAAATSPRGSRTMSTQTRREFFADVGKGMLVASVGSALAADLGVGYSFAEEKT